MSRSRNFRLKLESLDDRVTPAMSAKLTPAGVLNFNGLPTDVLMVRQTAPNHLAVFDGVKHYGTYLAPAGLNINATSFKQALLVDIGDFTYTGNITINLGNGSLFNGLREVSIFDSTGTAGGLGTIAGNVTIRGGNGTEIIGIGRPAATATIDLPIQINGNVFVTTRFNAGNDQFDLVPGSAINGNVFLNNIDQISLGVLSLPTPTLATIGGNVVISNSTPVNTLTADVFAEVGGNLVVVSSGGSNKLAVVTIHDGSTIGGNVSMVLPNGGDYVSFGSQVPGLPAPIIEGSVNVLTGFGADNVYFLQDPVDLDGAFVNGNVMVNMGHGNNNFFFDAGAFVGLHLMVSAGNGKNFLGGTSFPNSSMDGTINGNLIVNLGQGANTVLWGGTSFGSAVTIQTGGGNDTVSVFSTALCTAAKLTVLTNGGNDQLNIDSMDFASAMLNGGFGTQDDVNISFVVPFNWILLNWEL